MSHPASTGRPQTAISTCIDHTTIIAINRDAHISLELHLLPPTSHNMHHTTEWLLLHNIPVSASLSRVLDRILAAERQAKSEIESSEGGLTTTEVERGAWIRVARVGYVLSEIHAYCMILQCGSAEQASLLKMVLEKDAALGATTPVECVIGTAVTLLMDKPYKSTKSTRGAQGPGVEQRVLDNDEGPSPVLPHSGQLSYVMSLSEVICANLSGPDFIPIPTDLRLPSATQALSNLGSANCRGTPLTGSAVATTTSGSAWCSASELCAICQEELSPKQPRVITLCHHTFHTACYACVPSAFMECPLCRFSLYDLLNNARCEECRTYEDLWVCLICGHVGCGRGRHNHQQLHYDHTGHSCTWQSSTNRVWSHRSRMFLSQEVSFLLGEHDEKREVSDLSKDCSRDGGEDAAGVTGGDVNLAEGWVTSPRWVNERDQDLQAALTESKEEAVQHFYADVLRTLLEEQRLWYESLTSRKSVGSTDVSSNDAKPPLRTRAPEHNYSRGACATAESATNDLSSREDEGGHARGLNSNSSLKACVEAEHEDRVRIVNLYVEEVRQLFITTLMALKSLIKQKRVAHEDLCEQMMLLIHRNGGLTSRIRRLEERGRQAEIHGEKSRIEKQQRARELQEEIAALLDKLTGK
ncbi:unnamed protein product [Phytomonas sp. EM1]|nr:unnamed protein product [Phytomonas sp. EM1]|eukprot:CCW64197.1 unnamed protein product [Phytomonas sp. isolate EM1]